MDQKSFCFEHFLKSKLQCIPILTNRSHRRVSYLKVCLRNDFKSNRGPFENDQKKNFLTRIGNVRIKQMNAQCGTRTNDTNIKSFVLYRLR